MPCKSLWWAEKEGEEWRDKSFVPSPFQYLVPTTHWLLSGHTAALNRFLRMSKNFWGLRGCARGWLWNGWGVNLSTFLEVGEGKGSAVHPLARAQNPPNPPRLSPSVMSTPNPLKFWISARKVGGRTGWCREMQDYWAGAKYLPKMEICPEFSLHLRRICRLILARRNYERLRDEMCFDGQMCLARVL